MNLKELQRHWYQKLKDDGFVDIEESFQFHSHYFGANGRAVKRNIDKRPYFEKAELFLNEFDFESDLEYLAWKHHCDGKSVREISGIMGISKSKAHRTIQRLADIMIKAIL